MSNQDYVLDDNMKLLFGVEGNCEDTCNKVDLNSNAGQDVNMTSESQEVLDLPVSLCNKNSDEICSLNDNEKFPYNGENNKDNLNIDDARVARRMHGEFKEILGLPVNLCDEINEECTMTDSVKLLHEAEGNCKETSNKNILNVDALEISSKICPMLSLENGMTNVISDKDSLNIDVNQVTRKLYSESEEILGLPINLSDKINEECGLTDSVKLLHDLEDNCKETSSKSTLNADVQESNKISPTLPFENGIVNHHDTNQDGTKKFICDVCKKEFNRKCFLMQHKRIHTGERPFSCHICEKRFMDKKTLKRHIHTHIGEKTFFCDICNKAFLEKKNLVQHVFIHTGEQPYSCDVCNKKFKAKRDLKIHIPIHSEERPFLCEVCQKRFHSKVALSKHSRVHYSSPKEKLFIFGVCQKAFKSNSSLTEHLVVHTGEKAYICSVCRSSFTRKSSLNRHFLQHTGEKPHVCPICQKVFSLKYHLTQHIRTHSDDKPFLCDICQSAFRTVGALNFHSAIHSGERPHICHICQNSFSRKSSLIRHLQKQHNYVALETKNFDVSSKPDIEPMSALSTESNSLN